MFCGKCGTRIQDETSWCRCFDEEEAERRAAEADAPRLTLQEQQELERLYAESKARQAAGETWEEYTGPGE